MTSIGYAVSNKKKNRTRGYSIFSVFLFPRSITIIEYFQSCV